MEFVAANERAAPAERSVGEKPHDAVAEMQLAFGEARRMPEQTGHGVALAGRVFQAFAQNHVAAAFAVDRPRFGKPPQVPMEMSRRGEHIGVQFRIAAGQPAAIGVSGGGSSASGENGRISAPALRQASTRCG